MRESPTHAVCVKAISHLGVNVVHKLCSRFDIGQVRSYFQPHKCIQDHVQVGPLPLCRVTPPSPWVGDCTCVDQPCMCVVLPQLISKQGSIADGVPAEAQAQKTMAGGWQTATCHPTAPSIALSTIRNWMSIAPSIALSAITAYFMHRPLCHACLQQHYWASPALKA